MAVSSLFLDEERVFGFEAPLPRMDLLLSSASGSAGIRDRSSFFFRIGLIAYASITFGLTRCSNGLVDFCGYLFDWHGIGMRGMVSGMGS